jgi:predicted ribosomally synthesized peptide with nif11-like leader
MPKSSVVQFLETVSEPPGLEEFQAALNDSVEAMVQLGEKKGYAFTAQELRQVIAELMEEADSPENLSEKELEAVVGGVDLTYSSLGTIVDSLHNYHTYENIDDYTIYWSV